MNEFSYIPDGETQFGFSPYALNFDHPGWTKLKSAVSADWTALIDNTTLQNALTVMQEGLSNESSRNALLLPDLATVFFAYSYFDNVIVLDQGLLKVDAAIIQNIFPELTVVRWKDISRVTDPRSAHSDGELSTLFYNHHLQLTTIMEEFFKWRTLHVKWVETWSKIYGVQVRPVHFRRESEIDALLNSPAGKLTEAWTEEKDPLTQAIISFKKFAQPMWTRRLSTQDDKLSALASYHTFRSIFYFCLADAFNWSCRKRIRRCQNRGLTRLPGLAWGMS
jgi:hypothetical protein